MLESLTIEALYGFDRAKNGAPHRLTGKGGAQQMIENEIVRRIEGLTDFLNDDAAFAFEFGLFKNGVLQDVGKEIDCERQIALHHAGVIGGCLMRRMGVQMTADIFDFFGNGSGRAALGALEGHVFQQMRDAMLMTAFVTCACIDPNAD